MTDLISEIYFKIIVLEAIGILRTNRTYKAREGKCWSWPIGQSRFVILVY